MYLFNDDEILKLFLPEKGFEKREWMLQPNEQDGYIYATDAHALIRRKLTDKEVRSYKSHPKTANLSIVLEAVQYHDPVTITFNQIQTALKNADKDLPTSTCPDCHGEREFSNEECSLCENKGEIQDGSGVFEYCRAGSAIQLGIAYISPYLLYRVALTMALCGVKKCAHNAGKDHPKGAQSFLISEYQVILMPMNVNSSTDISNIYDFKTGELITS